jgi:hypothetical protein
VLIGLFAFSMVVSGIFPTDPDSGYPPGSPVPNPQLSTSGLLHNTSVAIGFPAFLVACAVFVRRFLAEGARGWAAYTVVTGVVFVVATELAFEGFGRSDGLGALGGLFERTLAVACFAWIAALGLRLLARPGARRPTTSRPAGRGTSGAAPLPYE